MPDRRARSVARPMLARLLLASGLAGLLPVHAWSQSDALRPQAPNLTGSPARASAGAAAAASADCPPGGSAGAGATAPGSAGSNARSIQGSGPNAMAAAAAGAIPLGTTLLGSAAAAPGPGAGTGNSASASTGASARGTTGADCDERAGLSTATSPGARQAPGGQRSWRLDFEVKAGATATSNSGVTDKQDLGPDLVIDVAPKVTLQHEAGRSKLAGDLQLNTLLYAQGSQRNRVLPKGQLRLSLEAIERWFYLDAAAVVDQTNADPFAARGDGGSALNRVNTLQYSVSPYLQRAFTPTLSMTARLDLEWTKRRGEYAASDPRRDQRQRRALYRLEQLPQPLGGSIELNDTETRFINDISPVLRVTEARAVASFQVDPSLTVAGVLGRGRTEYLQASQGDNIAGGRLQWAPSSRTLLKAGAERRFFGTAYNTEFSHRSPYVGVFFNLLREPSGQPTSFLLSPGADVASLLDAIFITRFPNPLERASVVQGVLNGLGQPSTLTRPAEVFSDYAQLQRRANLAVVFQGRRTTASFRLITLDARQLNRSDSSFVPSPGFAADNRQRLVSLDINRRLQNDLRVDFSITSTEIDGLGALAGASTKENIVRLTLTWEVNPDLSVTAGLRRQIAESTVTLSAQEWALIAGLLHRF